MSTEAGRTLRSIKWAVWPMTAAVLLCLSAPSTAQDRPFKFEITPFAGYRTGGSFDEKDGDGRIDLNDSNAQGVMFNIKASPNTQYELLYARQSTDADTEGFLANDPTIDLDVEYFHFGGTYLFDGDTTRPFLALTIGLSRFDPGIGDSNSENFFSASLGGGLQLNATRRLGVRLEARVIATFVDEDSSIFCDIDLGSATCLIQVDTRTLTQWEARAGLVFRF
jgi:opacity protein-like surface antigen